MDELFHEQGHEHTVELSLPDKTILTHFVNMAPRQRAIYESYVTKAAYEIGIGDALVIDDAEDILKRLLRLVECASNPFLVDKTYHPAGVPPTGREQQRPRRAGIRGLGRGRTDLLVVWSRGGRRAPESAVDKFVIECKVLHKSLERTVREGVEQTAGYMDRCAAQAGHLVVFDRRPDRQWDEKIFRRDESVDGRTVTVWGM